MRFKSKRDEKHAEIRGKLRECGFSVWDTGNIGSGFPDLIVSGMVTHGGMPGHLANLLVEVKAAIGKKGGDSKDGQRLSPAQEAFFEKWKGPKILARSLEDVLKWFQRPPKSQR